MHIALLSIERELDLGPRTDYIWNIGDGRQGESGDLCAHHASSCLDRHHPERHHPERHTAQKKRRVDQERSNIEQQPAASCARAIESGNTWAMRRPALRPASDANPFRTNHCILNPTILKNPAAAPHHARGLAIAPERKYRFIQISENLTVSGFAKNAIPA